MAVRQWQGGLALAGLVLLGGLASAEETSETRMHRDITFLASDECEGRGVTTAGINKAADYIASVFRQAGLKHCVGRNGHKRASAAPLGWLSV